MFKVLSESSKRGINVITMAFNKIYYTAGIESYEGLAKINTTFIAILKKTKSSKCDVITA